jgi:hypothetical protein
LAVHGDQHFSIFGKEGGHGDVLRPSLSVPVATIKDKRCLS